MSHPREFELKQIHLDLLKHSWVDFDDYFESGGFAQDPKRPYGNSDVHQDIFEIIHGRATTEDEQEDEDLWDRLSDEYEALHRSVATAAQIVLSTQSFELGVYYRPETYNTQKWVKKETE